MRQKERLLFAFKKAYFVGIAQLTDRLGNRICKHTNIQWWMANGRTNEISGWSRERGGGL
jgi:hypothetical protein